MLKLKSEPKQPSEAVDVLGDFLQNTQDIYTWSSNAFTANETLAFLMAALTVVSGILLELLDEYQEKELADGQHKDLDEFPPRAEDEEPA
jgi:hypothetical protein